MGRPASIAIILFTFLLTTLSPVVSVMAEITPSDVQASVDRGIKWLIGRQIPDGSWSPEVVTSAFTSYFAMLGPRYGDSLGGR